MNQQEIRKWHNFVPMVLCYSSILQRRFQGRRRCRIVRSLLSCIWGYLVSMQKDLVFLHLFPVGCSVWAPPPPLFPPLFTTDSTNFLKCLSNFLSSWLANRQWLFKKASPGGGGTHILVQRSSVARVSIGSSGKQIFAQRKHVLEIKSITYLSGVSSLKVRSILAFNFCFDQLFSQLFLRSGSFLSWNNSLNSFNSSSLRFPTVKCACVWLARSMPKTRASTSVACALDDEIIFVGYFLKTKQKN